MSAPQIKTMRDAVIGQVYERMARNDRIFFLSADMGAPLLDKVRADYPDRFINMGIAEQNLVNVAAGLALEGYSVYTLAIAAFYMRAAEQIRNHMAMSAEIRAVDVNMLGVGAGVSYDLSGPSHHCLEDISVMRTLPNLTTVSLSDWVAAKGLPAWVGRNPGPKYIRLDGKPLPAIYDESEPPDLGAGFCELRPGEKVCLVATGHMTHKALKMADIATRHKVGVVDLFLLSGLNRQALYQILAKYRTLITLEEGFIGKGGMDALIARILQENDADIKLKPLGFQDTYHFKFGNREFLYDLNHCGTEAIQQAINDCE